MTNNNTQKSKKNKLVETKNVFETLKYEAKVTTDEFFKQLLGQQQVLNQKRAGELSVGQSVEINEVLNGKEEQSMRSRYFLREDCLVKKNKKQIIGFKNLECDFKLFKQKQLKWLTLLKS